MSTTRPADYAVTLTTIICALIAGCATGEIRRSVVNGETLVEHIDTNDQPSGCSRRYSAGCYKLVMVDGKPEKHVWRSDAGPGYMRPHEYAHRDEGMLHTAWSRHHLYSVALTPYQQSQARRDVWCATIIAPAKNYPLGHLVCLDGRSEWTIAP